MDRATLCAVLIHHARDRRYVLQARNSLQNRARAYLRTLHASAAGHFDYDALCRHAAAGTSRNAAGLACDDALPLSSHAAASSAPRQAGDHDDPVPLPIRVPAWLRKPPPGLSRAQWQPARFLTAPVVQMLCVHRDALQADIAFRERQIADLAKQLPVWAAWLAEVRGMSPLGLGLLIGETGDLWHYGGPAKLWKRLGVAVIDGQRQRKTTDKVLAERMGYNPRRRAVMFNVAEALIKQNRQPDGTPGRYRQCYLDRKALERTKGPDVLPIIAHRRASRYMSKWFVKHLWDAWRTVDPDASRGEG